MLAALAAAAQGPDVKLPPSGEWAEIADPAPPPGATGVRFFTLTKNPAVRLRVATMPGLRQSYTTAFVMGLSGQMGERARKEGRELRVLEALVFEVDGASVAKLRSVDGPTQALLYWLPGEEGDVVVSLMGMEGAWDEAAEQAVGKAINGAKGLRGPDANAR